MGKTRLIERMITSQGLLVRTLKNNELHTTYWRNGSIDKICVHSHKGDIVRSLYVVRK